jgi:ABC-type multidrug transport system permease subunit
MRPRVLWQIGSSTLREFLRSPEAIFWTYGFPLLMALVLGLAFQHGAPGRLRVIVEQAAHSNELRRLLAAESRLEIEVATADEAKRLLDEQRADAVLHGSLAAPVLRRDPQRGDSETVSLLVERALNRGGRELPLTLRLEDVSTPGARYVDWLIPGLIGLNLLGAGLWGIGYNIVYMRVRHLLRRLIVAPMGRAEFLFALLLSRFVLTLPDAFVIALFALLLFGTPVACSFPTMLVIVAAGAFAFLGLGLLVASRARTLETIGGLMNFVLLPMWLCGGSFFENSRFPGFAQPLVQALPLSQFNVAMREAMLHGAGLPGVVGSLLYLLGFGVACFLLAVRWFRWV